MCVLSVCQNRVEVNKITLEILKFISVHVGRPAHEMTSNTSNGP